MALNDLSLVTESLITLLRERVKLSFGAIIVLPQAPDKLDDSTKNTLSLYLYHAREDAHYKNAAARSGAGTVDQTPLSLCLYYILTAHHYEADLAPNMLQEQKLMGYALKAMHDVPVITDDTKVGAITVLSEPLLGNDNKLQIIYRPVAPEESATFWNGDDQRLVRFSAFYEVRVVLLEPEPLVSLPGYVLSVGNYVLPTGVMHIASTHSVVRFTPPGGQEVALPASPARVALKTDELPGPLPPNNQLQLRGSRLGGGRLVLRSPLFNTPNNRIVVEPALNLDWDIKATSTQLTARIQDKVEVQGIGPIDVLPGTYGVSIETTTQYSLPGNLSKTITTRSNEWAISFTPFIEASTPGPAPVSVTTAAATLLLDTALVGEIEVFVAGVAYTGVAGAPGPRQYKIDSDDTILVGAPFEIGDLGIYPLRLIVRGAEAPPFWIEVTA